MTHTNDALWLHVVFSVEVQKQLLDIGQANMLCQHLWGVDWRISTRPSGSSTYNNSMNMMEDDYVPVWLLEGPEQPQDSLFLAAR